MKRLRLTARQRVAIFDRVGGICRLCERKIQAGEAWQLDHRKPLWLGGPDAPENMVPVHMTCHAGKTSREHAVRAKGDRVRAAHLGVKSRRHRWGYGRDEPWKKRLDGTVVKRNQEG